jgi:hypothetical protein
MLGVFGGMATYYLTESKSGQNLKHKLIDIYDSARIESGQWLEDFVTSAPNHPATPVLEAILKPSSKPSLLTRLKSTFAKNKSANPSTATVNKTKPKHYFQTSVKKKR